jgi:hypothetical protein
MGQGGLALIPPLNVARRRRADVCGLITVGGWIFMNKITADDWHILSLACM